MGLLVLSAGVVAEHHDSRDIDSEIAYALSNHFVDEYNSSMWFTAYFNKDNQLMAKSKPNVFTN